MPNEGLFVTTEATFLDNEPLCSPFIEELDLRTGLNFIPDINTYLLLLTTLSKGRFISMTLLNNEETATLLHMI